MHERLAGARAEPKRTVDGLQSGATVRQIDHLVYGLYGSTDDEICIVHQAAARWGVAYAGASPLPSHSSLRSLSQVVRRRFAAILAGMSSRCKSSRGL